MASIVVSGDTSGAVTISAPAVAGTTTLTLPTSTDTLATLTNLTLLANLATPSFGTTIGVGGATASSNGSGITFPATQSASSDGNTLDDYEEGTWTPANSSSTALTINNTATYIKIGKLVFISADITNLSQDSVYGLPFTSANTPGVVTCGYNNIAAQTLMGGFNGGTTNLTIRKDGATPVTPSTQRVILAGCYIASA